MFSVAIFLNRHSDFKRDLLLQHMPRVLHKCMFSIFLLGCFLLLWHCFLVDLQGERETKACADVLLLAWCG